MAVYGFTSRRAIAGCLYGAIVTGCFYGFSMPSRALKKQFGLSQSQLDNINTVPYAFGLLSPLFGKLSILLGPRLSKSCSAGCGARRGSSCSSCCDEAARAAVGRAVALARRRVDLRVQRRAARQRRRLLDARRPLPAAARAGGEPRQVVRRPRRHRRRAALRLGFGVPDDGPRRSTACCSGRARRWRARSSAPRASPPRPTTRRAAHQVARALHRPPRARRLLDRRHAAAPYGKVHDALVP